MPKAYFTYLPEVAGTVAEEIEQCVGKIGGIISDGYLPVKLNFFAGSADLSAFLKTREYIRNRLMEAFRDSCPAFCVTAQAPEKPAVLAMEVTCVTKNNNVGYRKHLDIPYTVVNSDEGTELWAAGVSSYQYHDDTRNAATQAFEQVNSILAAESMSMNNIVRQWNYIGNILKISEGRQNYQVFNEVRNEYYTRYRSVKGYPAATGVGMMHGGVILDFCALMPSDETTIFPVENPHQLNAYNYGQQVLKGASPDGQILRHPPQFERALLISNRSEAILHISGTASIIGQETVGTGDIEKQSLVTIGNMNLLSDAERLQKLNARIHPAESRYSLIRVYIRNREDFNIVRLICDERFPGVPALFVNADICRDDLLMEVEAEADVSII
jgi:enamine deaminase RidA (YjgF/YER057c/UK114 family)